MHAHSNSRFPPSGFAKQPAKAARSWAKRGGNAEELLAALKQWCLDAEETGIQALKDFVAELRTYTMPKAATA